MTIRTISRLSRNWGLALALIALICSQIFFQSYASELLRSNDVICLLGGGNVVAAQEFGYLETILRMKFPTLNLRFRSLAHEGDTVFEQPRDYNYPGIARQLDETAATVVLCYFGQMESLQGSAHLREFIAAYEKLLDKIGERRVMLVSPFKFERAKLPLPDLSVHNGDVLAYSSAIEALSKKRRTRFLNLVETKDPQPSGPLTSDGLQLMASGHWHYDRAIAAQLGAGLADGQLGVNPQSGALSPLGWEQTRQKVLAKNRLWFAYYRPMNWAFLGGDRTDQPSSRDYRDPKIRWFPDEMKKFLPLLEREEAEITQLAARAERN